MKVADLFPFGAESRHGVGVILDLLFDRPGDFDWLFSFEVN